MHRQPLYGDGAMAIHENRPFLSLELGEREREGGREGAGERGREIGREGEGGKAETERNEREI